MAKFVFHLWWHLRVQRSPHGAIFLKLLKLLDKHLLVNVRILAIPLPAILELPADLLDGVSPDVTVVDTSNYYPGMRDSRIAEQGMTESVWVAKHIGQPVIKAFNNALAYTLAELGQPEGTPGGLAIAAAGDNQSSKQKVMQLVNDTGFDAVDAGSLENSWRQQPSTPAYCCDLDADAMRQALAAAIKGEAPKKRGQMPEHFAKLGVSPKSPTSCATSGSQEEKSAPNQIASI